MSTVTDRERYVVHLTVAADDLPAARLLARAIGRSLAFLPELVLGRRRCPRRARRTRSTRSSATGGSAGDAAASGGRIIPAAARPDPVALARLGPVTPGQGDRPEPMRVVRRR